MTADRWVEHHGTADALHSREVAASFDAAGDPECVWDLMHVAGSAIVLGSTQSKDDLDMAAVEARDVEVARRRSGGGAVWLDERSHWVDVTIGRDDPRWSDDVGAAFTWLGEAMARAVARQGVDVSMHRGRMRASEWSRTVCFAGVGPGEILVEGRKLLGVSQRRVRGAARFQVVAYDIWDPVPLIECLRQRVPVADASRWGIGLLELGLDGSRLLADLSDPTAN